MNNYTINLTLISYFFRTICLLSILLLLFSCSQEASTSRLNPYFEPKPVEATELSVASPAMLKAYKQYQKGHYAASASLFEEVLQTSPDEIPARLYGAISFLSIGQTDNALRHLQWLTQQQPSVQDPDVNWYLGLVHLRRGENELALPYFVDLKAIPNPYQSRSLEVLETFAEGRLFIANTVFDHVYHIGNKGFDFTQYFQVAKSDLVEIRCSEDERQLYLKYNIPMPNEVTVRLYDESGTLQYMEKLSDIEEGSEKKLNLLQLHAGGYNLEVNLDSGRTLNQRIEIHVAGS